MNPVVEPNINTTTESNPANPVVAASRADIDNINLSTGKPIDTSKQRHFLAAFFLSYIFGVFGVDRFYLGKIWTGIFKFLTFGGLGIWALIDLNVIVSGGMRDKQGNKLIDADKYRKFAGRTMLFSSLAVLTLLVLLSLLSYYVVTEFMSNGGLNGIMESILSGVKLPNIDIEQLKNLNVGL